MKSRFSLLSILMMLALQATVANLALAQDDTLLAEKVFVQTDKPYYLSGETVHYKASLVSYQTFAPSNASEVLHISLWNAELDMLIQQRIELKNGFGHGEFELPTNIPSGQYLLTAHTNWMLNFKEVSYSKKILSIINSTEPTPTVADKELSAQFFPEGNELISNHVNKVAFHFSNSEQRINGWIVNNHEDTLSQFNTLNHGYGSVDILAKENESYFAVVDYKGTVSRFPIGKSSSNSAAIRLVNQGSDSLAIVVNFGDNYVGEKISLLVQNKGQIILGSEQNIVNRSLKFIIPKSLLGKGLNQAVILNDKNEVISERLTYNPAKPTIWARVLPEDTMLKPRTKVTLPIQLLSDFTTKKKLNLSVSIKNAEYFASTSTNRIDYNINLLSEIDFVPPTNDFVSALDNSDFMAAFLLTKKLSSFSLNGDSEVENNQTFYPRESKGGIPISGKVYNRTNGSPMANSVLYSSITGTSSQFNTTRTDSSGAFYFSVYPFSGKADLILKLANVDEGKENVVYELDSGLPKIEKEDFKASDNWNNASIEAYREFMSENQIIERIYYPSAQTSNTEALNSKPFFGNYTFSLDYTEYIKLDNFREIVKELIPGVELEKNGQLKIQKYDPMTGYYLKPYENSPLILIDGLPLFDTNKVFSLRPESIKTINVLNNQYNVGGVIFDGVFEITTLTSDYYRTTKTNHGNFNLQGFSNASESTNSLIATRQNLDHTPDFRSVLYWNPSLEASTNETFNIEFFTSDAIGDFILEVQGMDDQGNTVYYKTVLRIR